MTFRPLLLVALATACLGACAAPQPAQIAQGSDSASLKSQASTGDRSGESGGDSGDSGPSERSVQPAAPPPAAESALPVEVFRVSSVTVEDALSATGELRADEEVELRPEEGGRIVSLDFREGQRVRSGDLLVKINDADLVAERRRLGVQRQMAERNEQRLKTLLAEQTVSQEVYDEALTRLEVIDADLERVEAEIAKTEIHAPFSGVVGLRQVSEGSYITPSTVVARLQRLDPIKLDFAVPEKYAGEIGPGDTVDFTVSGSERTFTGEVYAVEPRIDVTTRTVRVRARASNADRRLFPGAFAKVRLVLDAQPDALMIPSIALIPGNEGTTVYVAVDGKAEPRRVTVGKRTENRVQILSGLEENDAVIVSGILQVRPGAAVETHEWEPVR